MKSVKVALLSICLVGFLGVSNTLGASECNTGGPGASSCTDSGSVSILYGLTSFSYENSISCDEGYYACCNGDRASCIEESEPESDSVQVQE